MLTLIKELENHKALFKCKCGEIMRVYKYAANKQITKCRKCAIKEKAITIRNEQSKKVLIAFKQTHGTRYDYSNVVYVKNTEKVKIICKEHGEFEQTPKAHKAGNGCHTCAQISRSIKLRKYNTTRPAYLYYVYFETLDLYKIGVTINLKTRFNGEIHKHKLLFFKQIDTEQKAYYLENVLLSEYKAYKYQGVNLLHRGGNTELLMKNILDSLITSVETIESTQEFKNLSGSE